MALGDMIRKTRIKLNMTQDDLAERVGLSKSSISQYESGKKLPRYKNLLQLAVALNLDVQVLVNENVELSKGIGWGRLKGKKHELSYIPKYKNDPSYASLVLEEIVPYVNPGFNEGNYLWFIPDKKLFSNPIVFLVQQNQAIEPALHVLFQPVEGKSLQFGEVITKHPILIKELTGKTITGELIIIGRVVQIAFDL